MLVDRVFLPAEVPEDQNRSGWPFTLPCVSDLRDTGLELTTPVTFLVGENGSGKSTLVEAIAEAFGLDAQGGRAGRKYGNDRPRTPLGDAIRLELTRAGTRMRTGPRLKQKGFFLRSETAFGMLNFVSGMPGYWQEDIATMSHGEGFLTVFDTMFRQPGLYLMDEPEAALSFTSCLSLLSLMHRLAGTGAQIICATHSPVLAALPGARILEIGDHGIRSTQWKDVQLVDHWRRFMQSPDGYLHYLLKADEES